MRLTRHNRAMALRRLRAIARGVAAQDVPFGAIRARCALLDYCRGSHPLWPLHEVRDLFSQARENKKMDREQTS